MPSSGHVWFVKVIIYQWVLRRRQPQQHFQFSLNISSRLFRIKLHTKNQPPSLLNPGDSYADEEDLSAESYEEDLKIRIWNTTSTTYPFFLSIFLLFWSESGYIP